MGRKKSEGEIKSHQQHLLMAPSEVKAVDDWAFEHRLRSRGDAIRRLCKIAIETEAPIHLLAAMATFLSREMANSNEGIRKRISSLDAEKQSEVEQFLAWNQKSATQVMSQVGIALAAFGSYTRQGNTEDVIAAADAIMADLVSATARDTSNKAFDDAFRRAFGMEPKEVPINSPPADQDKNK